jgi:anti-sigma B factor antagonist
MEYDVQKKGKVVVIAPSGEIDASNIPELQGAFDRVLKEGSTKIVVDMSGVSYMDSSALGVLVNSLKLLRREQGGLKLANLNGNVERIFKLTRLIHFFEAYPTTEQAVLSFN